MAFSFSKKSHSHRKTWLLILGFIVLFFVVLRMILPSIVVSVTNRRLANESPYFAFHIKDIDLHLIRGQYVVEGITGKMKSTGETFLKIDSVVGHVPWKQLFRGLVVADVTVNKPHLAASQMLLNQAKLEGERLKEKYPPKEEKEPKQDSRMRLRKLSVVDGDVLIHDFMSFKGSETRSVTDIEVLAENLIPSSDLPDTPFQMTANVFGPAPLKVDGVAKLDEKPLAWDTNIMLKNFDLTTINPFIKEKVQAFIEKGKLDNYAEVTSAQGVITGYEKPFVSKLKMDTPEGGFHFTGAAAATGGNLVKVLLTDSESKTLATKIPFTYKDKLDFEILPALTKAVQHKVNQDIQPGIENQFKLRTETIQAEEAR